MRRWIHGGVFLLALLASTVSLAQASWLAPDTDDLPTLQALSELRAGDAARSLRLVEAADGEAGGGDRAAAPAGRHYVRGLVLAALGRPREALAATDRSLALIPDRKTRDYVRVMLLRSSLYLRVGDGISALGNAIQVPPAAQTAFGDAHPATTFARVLEAMVSAQVFERPRSLDMALGQLIAAQQKLAPTTPGREPDGEEFVSRALLYQSAGMVLLQRRSFADARRNFETAIGGLMAADRAAPPAGDTLRWIGILMAAQDDLLFGQGAVAAVYAKDPEGARRMWFTGLLRAVQLGGLERARWMITNTMTTARGLGDCQAVEALVVPVPVSGRDGQALRAAQLKEVGTCWTVVAKDPARAQRFFDEAQACADGGERCSK